MMLRVLLAVLVLVLVVPLTPVAAAATVELEAGESHSFVVEKGDTVQMIAAGQDAYIQVINRYGVATMGFFTVHCDTPKPRFTLSHKRLTYRIQCVQRKK